MAAWDPMENRAGSRGVFLVAGHKFVLIIMGMQGTEVSGRGTSPLPWKGEKNCDSLAQPLGEPDEPGAC